jgi:hypothetical protein
MPAAIGTDLLLQWLVRVDDSLLRKRWSEASTVKLSVSKGGWIVRQSRKSLFPRAWQEAAWQVVYRTIPYSEFKDHLEHREVVECSIGQDDIQSKIQPKTASATEKNEKTTRDEIPHLSGPHA